MVRLLIFLLGMLTTERPGRGTAWYGDDGVPGGAPTGVADPGPRPPSGGPGLPDATRPLPPLPPGAGGYGPAGAGWGWRDPRPRRRRIPLWVKWSTAMLVAGLIFRRAIASVVLVALSAALHFAGINAHLPHIKFAWPWQTISAGTTANTDLGPWVLQRIEGISRPALGRVSFNFYFTHKVSKSIGPWPCWYASTFYAVGHASATVDLNPGPAWWTRSSDHYQLRVLSRPVQGKPGHVAVSMVLPQPQLPQSVHDITIDNIPSRPIDTQHSWTYPGLGCGMIIRPEFAESVLYSQAQYIAFYKATHVPGVTGPLVRTAEAQAVQTIRNNFIQPTVNAFGYVLDSFNIRWASTAVHGRVSGR